MRRLHCLHLKQRSLWGKVFCHYKIDNRHRPFGDYNCISAWTGTVKTGFQYKGTTAFDCIIERGSIGYGGAVLQPSELIAITLSGNFQLLALQYSPVAGIRTLGRALNVTTMLSEDLHPFWVSTSRI